MNKNQLQPLKLGNSQPNQTSQQISQPLPADVPVENQDSLGEAKQKRPWTGVKINKREQRRRRLARLRKLLRPKNSVMVLNEIKTGVKFTVLEHGDPAASSMFTVSTEIDGKQYTGQGRSKMLAKQEAAENVLKSMLLDKLTQAASAAEEAAKSDTMTPTQEEDHDVMSDDSMSGTGDKPGDDVVPWESLASFALFKLFSDWHSQGTPIPNLALAKPSPSPAPQGPMKKVPENPTALHPVMLLYQLRPGTVFNDIRSEGTPPSTLFTVEVTIDGKSYTGTALSKKEAKKEAAKAALAGALQIVYDQ